MITNPDTLSKDKLKSELRKRGIKFNNNENKSYYVDLYRTMIIKEERVRGEFSSDDELRNSPKHSPRKSLSSSRQKLGKGTEALVQSMSNEELKEQLINYGETPGPINALTRNVYERKLSRLMTEGPAQSELHSLKRRVEVVKVPVSDSNESFVAEWSSDEEDEIGQEEDVSSQQEPYNLRKRQREKEALQTQVRPPSRRPPIPQRKYPPTTRRRHPQERSENCKIFMSFVLLVVSFVAAFLLYEHFTVPEGNRSLLTCGYDAVWDTLVAPLISKQEVDHISEPQQTLPTPEETPPPPPLPAEEPTSTEENADKEPVSSSSEKPPDKEKEQDVPQAAKTVSSSEKPSDKEKEPQNSTPPPPPRVKPSEEPSDVGKEPLSGGNTPPPSPTVKPPSSGKSKSASETTQEKLNN